ncbi:putative cation diffusion facilitator 1 protein [Phaeoacremonium minimum UCRPA7]|uniref:Putative cation diffusion facilitator 1 protein n=1 Tax=Phaeoacremonium minimum (strain UCR-PA7) TaxID=1286976 RepID=R8BI31_PHAM7|nr:putative cation diffusion facilitator 1 protein [Phaeoacremonium minimum UCRPA7]EON98966.1 putative cation diffusion facilitator 1 protein [Phaeoacremonium minimum UCRPA7]
MQVAVPGYEVPSNEDINAMLKSVDEHEPGERESFEKHNLLCQICTKGSLIANVFLAALQLYGAISSGSLSLITTCADSVLDPMAGLMLYMSHRAVDKVDHHKFLSGRARISTAGNIVFSFIMFSISLVLIVLSARDLAAGSQVETNGFHLPSVIAVTCAFATKLGLFFLCWTRLVVEVDIVIDRNERLES